MHFITYKLIEITAAVISLVNHGHAYFTYVCNIIITNAIRYGGILEQIQKQARKDLLFTSILSAITTFAIVSFLGWSYW